MSVPTITSMTPLTGTTNTVLTITGTNLSNISNVLFNGISVIVISTNRTPTTVTVNAPVYTGTVSITVVDNQNVATSPTKFTYVNQNQPTSTVSVTNFKSGSSDLKTFFNNMRQYVTFNPDITCQTKSLVSTLSVYKKNISLAMDCSPAGDTVITFGNRKKRVAWVAGGDGINSLAYSYDGLNWTGLGKTIFTSYGLAIGWNGTIWSAGGIGTNSLAYSYDGINWTGLGTTIFTSYCHGLMWNQTMCVAVGYGTNSIAYSYDGLNWTGLGSSILTNGYSVGWNGNMWIITGEGGNSMAYSYDGINWTNVPNFYTKITNGLAVAWNGTMWVAGGNGTNSLAYSYNGMDWTGINSNALIYQVRGIAWNGTLWVAVGYGITNKTSTIVYSYDGKVWTSVSNSYTLTDGKGYGVSWNGKMFIMTGYPPNTLVYSYDGIHWIGLGSSVITSDSRAICHSNRYDNSIVVKRRRIVAGGKGENTLAYSTDGLIWKGLGKSLFITSCNYIAYNSTIWVAVGEGTYKIGWSFDGQTWYPVQTNLVTSLNCISWNGKKWLAGGSGTNNIIYSYNAIDWFPTNSKTIINDYVTSIASNGKTWIACGHGTETGIAYSDDGDNWVSIPGYNDAYKVVWNGTLFLAGGGFIDGSGYSIYSYDGYLWQRVYYEDENNIEFFKGYTKKGHAWNGTLWMDASGSYSYDTMKWTPGPGFAFLINPNFVIWTGTLWIIGGSNLNSQTSVTYSNMVYSYDGIKWYSLANNGFEYPYTLPNQYLYCACSDLWNEFTNTTITIQTPVVALGSGTNSIAYSSDGIQWKGLGNTIFSSGFAIAYSGSRWVAGGQGTHTLAYSDDGVNWIGLGSTILTGGCFEIAYNGTIWVAVGTGTGTTNTIAYSYDGKTWSPYSNTLFTIANSVVWSGSKWIAGGNGTGSFKLATSTDGKTWTGINQSTGIGVVICVEYNGNMWIAGGTIVPLIYSTDGLVWNTVSNPILTIVESLAWNGQMWIAVGGGSYTIAYSYDGFKWIGVPNSLALFPSGAFGITWNGIRWIAGGIGNTNTIAYSVDGILWNGLGKSVMNKVYGIGPRIFDAKLGMNDDSLTFSTDSYYQQGYTNITLGVSNTN